MRIAMLISGRATRYEVCLLPLLQSTSHTIDVFVSLNSEPTLYYSKLQENLSPWLKGIQIEPFQFPSDFHHTHPFTYAFQEREGRLLPFNQLSMYFNDGCAFQMATEYADTHGFEYDLYMKFRADICNAIFPDSFPTSEDRILFTAHAPDQFITNGLHKVPVISDAYAWGNRCVMAVYCDTYSFVLEMLRRLDGMYRIAFEDCLADSLLERGIHIRYQHKITYNIDIYRRIFETHKNKDGFPYFHSDVLDMNETSTTEQFPLTFYLELKQTSSYTEDEDSASS